MLFFFNGSPLFCADSRLTVLIYCPGQEGHVRDLMADAPLSAAVSSPCPRHRLAKFGARGELHLKCRSFARRRHHPDAAAVHLDDLLGDGEPEARAALGLGKGTVDLVELIDDAILLVERYAWAGICH